MRINSLDAFRGLAILLMIFVHFINWFSKEVPLYLKYDLAKHVTLGDLVAPLFLVAVGISLWLSYSKRTEKGQKYLEIGKVYFKRYFLLIVVGLVLDMLRRGSINFTWGVLETIGVAALIAFLLIRYSDKVLVAVIALSSAIYSYLSILPDFSYLVYHSPFGGMPAIISWLSLALIGVMIGKRLVKSFDEKKKFLLFLFKSAAVLIAVAVLLSFVVPLDRGLVSTSYVLLASAGGLMVFSVLFFLIEQKGMKLRFLTDFGLSALIVFIAQYLFIAIPIKLLGLHKAFPLANGIVIALLLALVFWFFVKVLKKYNVRLSF